MASSLLVSTCRCMASWFLRCQIDKGNGQKCQHCHRDHSHDKSFALMHALSSERERVVFNGTAMETGILVDWEILTTRVGFNRTAAAMFKNGVTWPNIIDLFATVSHMLKLCIWLGGFMHVLCMNRYRQITSPTLIRSKRSSLITSA